MKIKLLALGGCFLFLTGCAALTYHNFNYDMSLQEVRRPAEAQERYGEQKIFLSEKDKNYVFEDEMVKIAWLLTPGKIGFILQNKTEHPVRIIWDEAAYVDENGETHRVMHSGVKYINRDQSQPPSVVVQNGKLSEVIIPTDYISYVSGWSEQPLFPTGDMGELEKLKESSRVYIGKTFQVLLPIQIEGKTNDYVFIFKINDIKIETP